MDTILLYAASTAVNIQGCYRDNPGSRDLPVAITGFDRTLTPEACVAACRNAGYSYAGVQVVTSFFLYCCQANDLVYCSTDDNGIVDLCITGQVVVFCTSWKILGVFSYRPGK